MVQPIGSGVTRNLTRLFLDLRAAHLHHAEDATVGWGVDEISEDDRVRLVTGREGIPPSLVDRNAVAAEAGGIVATSLPPEWVDRVEQVQYTLSRIKSRMNELIQLHDSHVNRPTFDDNAQEEHMIEIMTQEITKMFYQGQRDIKSIGQMVRRVPGAKPETIHTEERMTRNVMASLAKELQNVSIEFRRRQTAYLQRLRGREDRASQFAIRGADFDTDINLDMPTGGKNDDIVNTFGTYDDRGFNEFQTQALQENIARVEEHEREITQIVSTIAELQTIFKDLATLVIDQGTILDNIAYNIEMASQDVEQGVDELKKGEKYQKRSRKSLCILLLLVAVIAMVFVVILTKA